jgi:type IV secretory pathway VirB4 component
MITVRIPKDIREYKEKLVAGLTARHLLCLIIGVMLVTPIIVFGKKFGLSMDVLSWAILLIIIPVGLIGFYRPDNMPFEKFLQATFRFSASKKKLLFFSDKISKSEEEQKNQLKISEKLKEQRSIELAIIFNEAFEKGEKITLEEANKRLVKTKMPVPKPPKNPKDNKNKKKEKREMDLKAQADNIQLKRTHDPFYIFTKKEQQILRQSSMLKEKQRLAEIKEKTKPIKTANQKAKKRKTATTTLPKTVQEAIPYVTDFDNGVFEVEKGVYSKLYLIDDLNYHTVSENKQVEIFANYAEFLNVFDENTYISVFIDNRVISKNEQESRIFYQMMKDKLDKFRKEYNKIMQMQMEVGRNEMVQEKYISATIEADSFAEATSRFHKIDNEVEDGLNRIGSSAKALSTDERLEILHDKFRKGHEGDFKVDSLFLQKQGISSKDYIAPANIEFDRKQFMINDEYYRVMYLNNLPAQISDDFFGDFVDNNFPLTATISILPIAQHEAIKKVNRQKTGMEANILQAQKKASKENYSAEIAINHKLRDAYDDAQELYDDLTKKNQKLFYVSVMVMFSAPTLEELQTREEILNAKARKITAQMQILTCRQQEGMKCCLPVGIPAKLGIDRALTSESTAIFIPFSCQELSQRDGFYYGLNGISRNLILLNRTKLRVPSGFIFGTSGSGKSFAVKREMLNVVLKDNETTILIIDPENEYAEFVKNFGGEVIKISPNSENYINPMEMTIDYGLDEDDESDKVSLETKKEKALRKKSDYIMSIITCMLKGTLSPQQRTFIDRCVANCYKEYLDNDFNADFLPNLQDLQNEFDSEKDTSEEARLVAEGAGYYTKGSMNIFAHNSNVNLDNRIISFNIRDLGDQLMELGLLIVLDFIWNKMCENNEKNLRTYCYADEIHVLFKNKDSAEFLKQLYKRGRKYGLVITGITQNIEDLLKSDTGRVMVSQSEFLLLLKQSNEDIKILGPMLRISEQQCADLERADIGSGLLKAGVVVVPFKDRFPKDTELYKMMSTNFNERADERINALKSGEGV